MSYFLYSTECLHYEAPRLLAGSELVRVPGIESGSQPWEGRVLPLNHTREFRLCEIRIEYFLLRKQQEMRDQNFTLSNSDRRFLSA